MIEVETVEVGMYGQIEEPATVIESQIVEIDHIVIATDGDDIRPAAQQIDDTVILGMTIDDVADADNRLAGQLIDDAQGLCETGCIAVDVADDGDPHELMPGPVAEHASAL
jgi:hypothetical protein